MTPAVLRACSLAFLQPILNGVSNRSDLLKTQSRSRHSPARGPPEELCRSPNAIQTLPRALPALALPPPPPVLPFSVLTAGQTRGPLPFLCHSSSNHTSLLCLLPLHLLFPPPGALFGQIFKSCPFHSLFTPYGSLLPEYLLRELPLLTQTKVGPLPATRKVT